MKITPLYDKVLIQKIKEEKENTEIYIPESSQEKPNIGLVIETGSGRSDYGQFIPLITSKGDKVIYAKFSGTEIKFEDKEYLIIRENDILAIISE
jgi:chaperonin GroES